MTQTDRLRAMLDERGVEWTNETVESMSFQGYFRYTYWGDGGGCCFCEPVGATPGTLGAKCDFSAIDVTPEQAVAYSLGVETCRMIYDEEASGDELWPTEEYYCSECGKHVYAGKPNYCPNCGRRVEQ